MDDVDTSIRVHRVDSEKHPVRISIVRGKSNRTIFLADDDVERLRQILQEAFRSSANGFKGELRGS